MIKPDEIEELQLDESQIAEMDAATGDTLPTVEQRMKSKVAALLADIAHKMGATTEWWKNPNMEPGERQRIMLTLMEVDSFLTELLDSFED